MNRDPDYSAAYVVLATDHPAGLAGHGLTFTIGRGTELCVEAIDLLAGHVVGRTVEDIAADMAGFWRSLVADSQLRWLGPEKGVVHLATAALVNAVWDLYAKLEGKPLWKLLADMTPEQLVACIDFRYIDDALSPGRSARAAARAGAHARRSRGRDAARRLPRLHDVRGLARLLGREDPDAGSRGDRERLHAPQAQGWHRRRVGPAPRPDPPAGDRSAARADARRQPGVGRRRGDRGDEGPRRGRSVVDRGADQPRRRARPPPHSRGGRADRRRDRRARAEPRHVQAAAASRARSTSARSTAAGWAGSTRCSRCC